ncbi:hypothetical protein GCK72_016195 [Caenorhabditis remanei]|uniref:Uncharacterized protein n=1 Tax=Caenorhabditis remanei TaxID=31234 RepID=A0A6A5GW68_CAERE|nr:hypothetical protein GCK72_016195 [Caenorhabditis remanei]KAF1759728.1 hypothetical protein GCK72_016195 [Caenorhabditis remanei]
MSSSIFDSPFPDEVDPRIEGFTAMVQRYLAHSKSSNQKKDHCYDCTWTVQRLDTLQKMTAEYAEMRKTDDDLIEWNTLILELVNKTEQNISSPPKRARVEEKDPLMQEQEAKAAETAAFWEDDRIECDFDDASEEYEDEEENQMEQDGDENLEDASDTDVKTDQNPQ